MAGERFDYAFRAVQHMRGQRGVWETPNSGNGWEGGKAWSTDDRSRQTTRSLCLDYTDIICSSLHGMALIARGVS